MTAGGKGPSGPEVLVIGAGPGGAMAALTLATAGIEVLLVDRAAFPRDKVCGCCLNAVSVSLLREAGLDESFWTVEGAGIRRLTLRARGVESVVPLQGGYAAPRTRLDSALVGLAVAAGATFVDAARARLRSVDDRACRVSLEGRRGREVIRPRVVICADGLGGDSLVGLPGAPEMSIRRRGGRLGVWAVLPPETESPRWGEILMLVARTGYVGMVRLRDGSVNLAAALDRRAPAEAGSPAEAVAEILSEAGLEGLPRLDGLDWKGTPLLTRRRVPPAFSRVFCVGDAARFVEPFTGEGMTWALAAGRLVSDFAREALEGWRPDLPRRWEHAYRRCLGPRQERCRRIGRALRYPRLVGAALRILAVSPALAAMLARNIHRPVLEDV